MQSVENGVDICDLRSAERHLQDYHHDLHEDGGGVHRRQETLTHWRLENGNWRLKIGDFRCKMQKKVKLFPICLHMWEFFCNFARRIV